MRLLPFLFLLATVLASGCSSSANGSCPDLADSAHITAVSGSDASVQLAKDSSAVLHLAQSDLLRREGEQCVSASMADLQVGSVVHFEVDAWAESYPMQGWPDQVVIG